MLGVERREKIRRAYYVEGKSIRQIIREMHHSYWTIRSALDDGAVRKYTLKHPKPAPVLGPYKGRIDELLLESEKQPRKQRYTSGKIYAILKQEGYRGSESNLRRYICKARRLLKRPPVYLPLSFDPGVDAQVDWGEATVILGGEEQQVQLFVMRLSYSRKIFVMAFPTQRQESFFAGHVAAFEHFGGVPHRIIYDNLKTAVNRILQGRKRVEQEAFVAFRSHHLFASRFCNPHAGNEKGQVENGVGYVRRNFMVPLLEAENYAALNQQLLDNCNADDIRRVNRQQQTIGEMWREEKAHLRPLPDRYPCCSSHEVTLNRYGQVTFETNRYSVPVDKAHKHLVLKAYPFQIEILGPEHCIARHPRSYEREQDILDPLHYLPLLAQRPGAFEHATPLRQWRATWPILYEKVLDHLRAVSTGDSLQQRESRAYRTFIEILLLHRSHDAELVEQALEEALASDIVHPEGVTFCLNRLLDPTPPKDSLDLSERPILAKVGIQKMTLAQYNQLLGNQLLGGAQ